MAVRPVDLSFKILTPEEIEEVHRSWKRQSRFFCNLQGCNAHPFSDRNPEGQLRWACVEGAHEKFSTTNPSIYFEDKKVDAA